MDEMTLNKKDGTSEKVEILMTFKIDHFNDNDYVIYKNDEKYYAARYIEENGNTNLITDLSDEEKEALSTMFDKLHNGGLI